MNANDISERMEKMNNILRPCIVLVMALGWKLSVGASSQAFFLSSSNSSGREPVLLSGDMRADWTNHGATAELCVADRIPTPNILQSWHKVGARVVKRIAWDPECSPEYVRRSAGFLALHEKADGVWLENEARYSDEWKQAIAEARIDVAVARYCKALAEKALAYEDKDNKVWIEGRRVMWFFDWMDFAGENLDTLRLEFVCYAKRLEQLLGLPAKKLPLDVGKPLPMQARFVPFEGRSISRVPVSLDGKFALSENVTFACDSHGWGVSISSKEGEKDVWPGGEGSLKIYIPDGQGAYLPYEFQIDLSPVSGNRAPTEGYGCWFLKERWEKGKLGLYGDPTTWRLRSVARFSNRSKSPHLAARFHFRWNEKSSGWTLSLNFSWLQIYGLWPSVRNGVGEKWFIAVDALPGVKPIACGLDWAKGRETNFKKLALALSCSAITERYSAQLAQVSGAYRLWHEERLYGFAKTKEPTYQRCDPESDKIFWERVVEPILSANTSVADMTHTAKDGNGNWKSAKLEKQNEAVKLSAYKSIGKLFDTAERVSAARRDYILLRYDGKMPPEPAPKKGPEGAAALSAPDADNDDDALSLDDKEF